MIVAFVLLNIKPGKEEEFMKKLESMKDEKVKLEEGYLVYGEYDVIIKLRAENLQDIREFVINKIRSSNYVEKSITLIVAP
ncbi:MAG: Lrp/AsnC ligand binding domain-containing protein [Nanopusillaceae archaeon]